MLNEKYESGPKASRRPESSRCLQKTARVRGRGGEQGCVRPGGPCHNRGEEETRPMADRDPREKVGAHPCLEEIEVCSQRCSLSRV